MPSLVGETVAANYLKAAASSQFGTRHLEVIKIASKPNSLDFGSSRSTLITLDSFDPSAVIVNVKAISNMANTINSALRLM